MDSYRVLIVDDQRDIRRLFAEGIKSLGKKIDVLESPSGEEALMVAALKPIDLLITDINLAGISGLDVVRRIRKRQPELQIILVTGVTDPNLIAEIVKAGVEKIFYKPLNIQELMEAVKQSLGIEKPAPVPQVGEAPKQEVQTLTMKEPLSAEVMLLQRLSRLALDLGASAAALLDETGKVLAQSGDFMQTVTDPILLGVVMSAYRAGMEVAHSLRKAEPESMLCFSGLDFSLCLVPLGPTYLVLLEGGAQFNRNVFGSGRPVIQVLPELQKLVDGLAEEQKPEAAPPPDEPQVEPAPQLEEIPAEPNPEDLAKVDALFSQLNGKKLKTDDLDAFWDSAAEKSDAVSGDRNVLTYEQARQMGLTPD